MYYMLSIIYLNQFDYIKIRLRYLYEFCNNYMNEFK